MTVYLVSLIILSIQIGLHGFRAAQYFSFGGLILIVLSVWVILVRAGYGAAAGLVQSQNTFLTLGLVIIISLITASQLAKAIINQERLAGELSETNTMLERRVVDRTRELSALYNVTSVASQALDVETAMAQSLQQVVEAMKGDAGTIHLLDESTQTLHLAIKQGLPSNTLAEIDTIPVGTGLPGWVIEHQEILVATDITTDPRSLPNTANQMTFQAYAGVPIQAGGSVLGVLNIFRERGHPLFGLEEVSLLGSIADQVGVVVESAKLRQQVEQVAVMEERSRLARDLHDSVTQLLYSINLFADVGRKSYHLGKLDQMYNSLVELGQIGQQALKEMRLFVYELRPTILDREGLVSALKNRLETVEGRANIETHLFVENDINLSRTQEDTLFHIAREALNNSLKHTDATLVTVRIGAAKGLIEMEITDNGQGFNLDEASDNGGLGLSNMQERIDKLDGELMIHSSLGEGMRLQVAFNERNFDG